MELEYISSLRENFVQLFFILFFCHHKKNILKFFFSWYKQTLFNSALWDCGALAFEGIEKEQPYSCCIQGWELRLQKQQYPLVPVENTFILNGLISHIVNWVLFRPTSKLIIIVYLLSCFTKTDPTKAEGFS